MGQIIKTSGIYQLPESMNKLSNADRFDYIYNKGVWLNGSHGESRSGAGSAKESTQLYINQLSQYIELLSKTKNKSAIKFFDAPCGDLNWMPDIFEKVQYFGGDISKDLVAVLKNKFPNINIAHFDIIGDEFPDAHIWHCRHCLFHLSLSDIAKSLQNFCKSKIEIAIITNHFLPDSITFDIDTGNFRFLDLTNFPFYLPKPKLWLLDEDPRSGKTAMASGVWTKEQVKVGVDNYKTLLLTETIT